MNRIGNQKEKKNVICNSQCACGVNRWGFFWPNKFRKVEKIKFWSSFSARDMKLTFYESIHWNHWGVEKEMIGYELGLMQFLATHSYVQPHESRFVVLKK